MTIWQEKYKLLVLDEIDSTNSEALRIARTCPSENYVIWAKNQTKSRGRNGKIWYSNLGNLHVSILLRHNINLAYIPQLSFIVSIAVYKTINSLASKSKNSIQLKWPNDILVNAKKISGILLESISLNNNNYLVIGIGININTNPINIGQVATNLSNENIEIRSLEEMLNLLMINFEKYFAQWKKEGFNKIRQYWLRRAYMLNKQITVNNGNSKVTGIFKNIDENGAIKIQLSSGDIITLLSAEF